MSQQSMAAIIDIQFNYNFDTNNFFVGHPERQSVLEAAAQVFESRLNDNLTAITPGGGNTWSANFTHPGTGNPQSVSNLSVPAGVIVVYAGGRNFTDGTLGVGGPGGFSANGTQSFGDTVALRGQVSGTTDFGPWGGSITFDTDASWYFDTNVNNFENIGSMSDFYSVALHELSHLLGFGTANSFNNLINGNGDFTGPVSMSLNAGLPVPLDLELGHWADGTTGDVLSPFFINDQEAAMTPSILDGTRKYFTELDMAALDDLGWQVIPEPASAGLLICGLGLACARRRRHA